MNRISNKSDKELAFLQDLFIAPDWGERFAELIDEHVKLPDEGKALYAAAGTGGHAMALQERAGKKLEMVCIDENAECLELALAKATATKEEIQFRHSRLDSLTLPDNEFDLVVGNASLIATQRVRRMFAEMVRVAAPGAMIALALPTASSFGEFFSIYWEALHNNGLTDHEVDVEHLITELPTVSEVEQMAEDEALQAVTSWTRVEEFDYDSGEQFLNSPLVSEFLMPAWLALVPEDKRADLSAEISRLINEERHEAEFALSVKATLVVGQKAHSH
ncbi:MAG TPA: methyltransferase domain-containing protein [Pyrinomonadaceae bacterium]|jgi:ubiquinone/menaquinone biosynthesis C-methylase UbiE|nr:methyltransferase domain-containing protein [Pyrinomonadaceae bacterium]